MALLEVAGLTKHFVRKPGLFGRTSIVKAVDDVTFSIDEGEMFGLVGESGSGKSTTGRCILRLIEPTAGAVRFKSENVLAFSRERMRRARRDMQIVFQDPYSSLNPRMRVARHRRGTARHPPAGIARRAARAGARAVRAGGPRAGAPRTLPARVQRRATPAHRHRAGARAQPGARDRRRGRVGARRVDSGAGRQAAAGSPGTAQAHVPVHRARFEAGGAHLRPAGGDVSRAHRRDG